ncbi:MAG: GWxTD domain-containing protein, partial [Acidobacteriota bacterium]|nr:GWxTD domain-containing protein [Acidobacteriota bacterium]
MTLLERWVQTPAGTALGWTLVHSLWEGAMVAVVLAVALRVIRSSRSRYAAACLAMLTMLAVFGITFGCLIPRPTHGAAMINRISPSADGINRRAAKDVAGWSAADFFPWLDPFWIAGVLIFHLRTLAGWFAARRLRVRGMCRAPDLWQERLSQLGARMRLSKPVALLESCLVDVPVVIGYLRPVILMPVGLLVGLPASQIELILLHELAHIRRYDYLVNLLQGYLEGLLFYHPAVWWISGVVRAERENCCDDLVVTMNGNAHEYALTLATLEQNRWSGREAALAATGGHLMKRIRRLLGKPDGPRVALTPVVSAGMLTIIAAVVLVAWQSKPAAFPYSKWINEDVSVTGSEREAFARLQTDAERDRFIQEHNRRVAYANDHFPSRSGIPGSKTDRGRAYINLGPPDEIESHPHGGTYTRPAEQGGGQTATFPFEQWRYHHIDTGGDVVLEFVDKTNTGEFHMVGGPYEKEVNAYVPGHSGTVYSS